MIILIFPLQGTASGLGTTWTCTCSAPTLPSVRTLHTPRVHLSSPLFQLTETCPVPVEPTLGRLSVVNHPSDHLLVFHPLRCPTTLSALLHCLRVCVRACVRACVPACGAKARGPRSSKARWMSLLSAGVATSPTCESSHRVSPRSCAWLAFYWLWIGLLSTGCGLACFLLAVDWLLLQLCARLYCGALASAPWRVSQRGVDSTKHDQPLTGA